MSQGVERTLPVTVVIPTLGGPTLVETLHSLVGTEVSPFEILVCVPAGAELDPAVTGVRQVRVVRLPLRGQVQQRHAGFLEATQPLVLQLDDDVTFKAEALEVLADELSDLGPGNAIAPTLHSRGGNGQSVWVLRTGFRGGVDSLIAYLRWGAPWGSARMGTVSSIGHNFGVDSQSMEFDRIEVDWLPGGCILHWRESLIYDDFYPFNGKAYAEDVIHSWLLSQAGVRMWITKKCSWEIDPIPGGEPLSNFHSRMRAVLYSAQVRHVGLLGRVRLVSNYFVSDTVFTTRLWFRSKFCRQSDSYE